MIDHPELADSFDTVPTHSLTIIIRHEDERALARAFDAAFDAAANIGGIELQVIPEPEPAPANPVGARAVGAAVVAVIVSTALAFSAVVMHVAWELIR